MTFIDDVSSTGCLISNEMGNMKNVVGVTARGNGRIKESHENFKLLVSEPSPEAVTFRILSMIASSPGFEIFRFCLPGICAATTPRSTRLWRSVLQSRGRNDN